MFSRLRNRFGIPGVISVIALVFATMGGAYAANGSDGSGDSKASASAVKKGSKGPRGPRGPRGPKGPAGPAGQQGPQGSQGPQGPAGAPGLQGLKGAPGAAGATGATGLNGAAGPTGATGATGSDGSAGATGATGATGPAGGFAAALPSGETLTGSWGLSTMLGSSVTMDTYSFSIPLAAALDENHVKYLPASHAGTTECPGKNDSPDAAPGYLCVFEGASMGNTPNPTIYDPLTPGVTPGAGKTGFLVIDPTVGLVTGTWAVTAP